MLISLCANELGLSIKNSEMLWKWLWLESRVIDCDSSRVKSFCEKRYSSRVESPFFSTWLKSSQQKSWLDSSWVIDTSYAITGLWPVQSKCIGFCGFINAFIYHTSFWSRISGHCFSILCGPVFFFFSEAAILDEKRFSFEAVFCISCRSFVQYCQLPLLLFFHCFFSVLSVVLWFLLKIWAFLTLVKF